MKLKSSVLLVIMTVLLAVGAGSLFAETEWEYNPDVAQYGGADWENEVMRIDGLTVAEAMEIAESDPYIDFFFITTGYTMNLGDKGIFRNGDTVFFSGEPWLGSAPGLADTYVKMGGGSDYSENYEEPGVGYYGDIVHLDDDDFYYAVAEELVFVDFYADWCGPCVAFGPVYEEVAAIHADTMFVKMDVDMNTSVPGDFGVQYIPYIAAVYDGEEVGKFEGNRTVDSFSDWCASYIEEYSGY